MSLNLVSCFPTPTCFGIFKTQGGLSLEKPPFEANPLQGKGSGHSHKVEPVGWSLFQGPAPDKFNSSWASIFRFHPHPPPPRRTAGYTQSSFPTVNSGLCPIGWDLL